MVCTLLGHASPVERIVPAVPSRILCSEKLDVVRLTFYTAPVSLACLLPFYWLYEVRYAVGGVPVQLERSCCTYILRPGMADSIYKLSNPHKLLCCSLPTPLRLSAARRLLALHARPSPGRDLHHTHHVHQCGCVQPGAWQPGVGVSHSNLACGCAAEQCMRCGRAMQVHSAMIKQTSAVTATVLGAVFINFGKNQLRGVAAVTIICTNRIDELTCSPTMWRQGARVSGSCFLPKPRLNRRDQDCWPSHPVHLPAG